MIPCKYQSSQHFSTLLRKWEGNNDGESWRQLLALCYLCLEKLSNEGSDSQAM